MIICRKCSRRHPNGTEFCTCGAYLAFDGREVEDEVVPDATAVPESGVGDHAHQAGESAEMGAGTTRPGPAPAAEPAPWSGFGTTPQPEPSGVDAVQPDTERRHVAQPHDTPTTTMARAGDRTCPACGTPNAPTLSYCRHCAYDFQSGSRPRTTADEARPSRWKSWTGRLRPRRTDPRSLARQARSMRRGGVSGRTRMLRSGGILIVIGGLLAFLGPWRHTIIRQARDVTLLTRYEVIDTPPEAVSAQPTDPANPVQVIQFQDVSMAFDRFYNTAWATPWIDIADLGPVEAPATDECDILRRTDGFIRITFDEPTSIDRLQILPGRHVDDPFRDAFMRPRLLQLRSGETCRYVEVDDDGELQQHEVELDDVETLDVRIVGVYADGNSEPITEVSALVVERRK